MAVRPNICAHEDVPRVKEARVGGGICHFFLRFGCTRRSRIAQATVLWSTLQPNLSRRRGQCVRRPAHPTNPHGRTDMDRNRLSEETSPYLLQHKDNPVHWQPWNDMTLAAAKAADKPI